MITVPIVPEVPDVPIVQIRTGVPIVQNVQAVQIVQQAQPFNRGGDMSVKNFEDLEIWKEARRLTGEVYRLTKDSKFSKDFGLSRQIQSAAVSVMSNIAEGFERGGNQEFTQFLYIAKGSCGEVRSQLYVALDQGYLLEPQSHEMIISFRRLSGMIGNLIAYLRRSGMKGEKFGTSKVVKRQSQPEPS
jgi:four helix bundle protein